MLFRLALNLQQSSCLSLLRAEITGVPHYARHGEIVWNLIMKGIEARFGGACL